MARYIDAEPIITTAHNECKSAVSVTLLEQATTADVTPVIHAHWVISTDEFSPMQRCTNCNFEIPVVATETEGEMYLYSYCPACGSRMDEPTATLRH